MELILAILLALSAITAGAPVGERPEYPNAAFVEGMLGWGAPLTVDGFTGMVWVCDPLEAGLTPNDVEALRAMALDRENGVAEVCYAGWSPSDVEDPNSEMVPLVGP